MTLERQLILSLSMRIVIRTFLNSEVIFFSLRKTIHKWKTFEAVFAEDQSMQSEK